MIIKDARLGPSFYIWLAVTSGVSQLQADQQVVSRAGSLSMLFDQCFAQPGQIIAGAFVYQKLIGICSSVVSYGNGLASPDQFRAASTEISPPMFGQICRLPVGGSIPSFHWMDSEAITDLSAVKFNRLPQRRVCALNHLGVARDRYIVFTYMP